MTDAIPSRAAKSWGTCAHCGGDFTLKKNGTLRWHGDGNRHRGCAYAVMCPGSGCLPNGKRR